MYIYIGVCLCVVVTHIHTHTETLSEGLEIERFDAVVGAEMPGRVTRECVGVGV